jgi:DNA-binding GntR family transcriptional regulator
MATLAVKPLESQAETALDNKETADMADALPTIDEAVLRTRSRADFVYESLRDAISDGRIAGGERVREEEVARNLGVSRTPVREALQRLQQRGLLVFGPGRGLMVAQLSQQQIIELYAMRQILEGSAARFAATHATADEIAILYELQQELKVAEGDPLRHTNLNRQFHQAIYEAAHNRYLMQTLEGLHDSFALLRSTTFRLPHRQRDSDEERRRIIAAIERRDADLAEKEAREHILQAQRTRFESAPDGLSNQAGVAARKPRV